MASGVLALGLCMTMPLAHAQTCTALTPVLVPQISTGDGVLQPPWTSTTNTTEAGNISWFPPPGFNGLVEQNEYLPYSITPSAYNTFQQTITGVAGGSELTFTASWANGGGNDGNNDGARVELDVVYNGVIYAQFRTSSTSAGPNTANGATAVAQNGATLTATAGGWTTRGGGLGGWGGTFRLTLPQTATNLPTSGVLMFQSRRTEVGSSANAVDDLYVQNVSMATPSVCLVKQTARQSGNLTFNFTATNADTNLNTVGAESTASITTTAANTPVAYDASSGIANVQPIVLNNGNQTVITEGATGGYGMSGTTCSGAAAVVNTPARTVTLPAGSVAAGTMATCTITNSRPQLQLQKLLPNGRRLAADQFTLNIAGPSNGAATTASVTTTGTGSTATGTANFLNADAGASYTLSETVPAGGGYASTISCTNANAGSPTVLPANGAVGTSFTIASLAAADNITCTFSNTLVTTLTIVKRVINDNGGSGTAAGFGIQSRAVRGANGGTNNVVFATPPVVSGTTSTYTSNVIAFVPDGGTEWLVENDLAGYTEGAWSCTGAGVTQQGTAFNNGGFAINPGFSATCTITNDDLPATVTVIKTSNGGVGTFNFTGSNGFANQTITTIAAGTGVPGATQTLTASSTATTITEAAPPLGFALQSIACSGLLAGATATPTINGVAGGNVVLNAAATVPGANIRCTFVNVLVTANLFITKTNTPGVNGEVDQATDSVAAAAPTAYVVTARNGGPAAAHGAVVRDQPGTGLSGCTVTACAVTGAAACPAAPGDVLTAGGVAIPVFPANSSVRFTVGCTVN